MRSAGPDGAERSAVEHLRFPRRKEPPTDASHVRNAIARFDQIRGVSDAGGATQRGHEPERSREPGAPNLVHTSDGWPSAPAFRASSSTATSARHRIL